MSRNALFGSRLSVEIPDAPNEKSNGPDAPDTAPPPRTVLYVPASIVAVTCGGRLRSARFVINCTTLAIASDPKSADCAPSTISSRSTLSVVRLLKLNVPPGSLSGMPSSSTLL